MPPTTRAGSFFFALALATPLDRPTPTSEVTMARTTMPLTPPKRPFCLLIIFIRYFPLIVCFSFQARGNLPQLRIGGLRAAQEDGRQVEPGDLRLRTVHVIGAGDEDVHEVRVRERPFDVLLHHEDGRAALGDQLDLVPHDVGVGG